MANIVTSIRIVCSILLLFFPAVSPAFYTLYIICGVSDMVDGTIARKTNSVSGLGAKLDSVADFCFILVCMIKLLPVIDFPLWIWIWIGGIAAIKLVNIISGVVCQKKFVVEHTILNKITGAVLFLFPITLTLVKLEYSVVVACTIATSAAIQEGHFIRSGKEYL